MSDQTDALADMARERDAAREATRRLGEVAVAEATRLRAELAAAVALVEQLRAALEWYADEDNYGCTPWAEGLDGGPRIDQDWGARARAAIESSRVPALPSATDTRSDH